MILSNVYQNGIIWAIAYQTGHKVGNKPEWKLLGETFNVYDRAAAYMNSRREEFGYPMEVVPLCLKNSFPSPNQSQKISIEITVTSQ